MAGRLVLSASTARTALYSPAIRPLKLLWLEFIELRILMSAYRMKQGLPRILGRSYINLMAGACGDFRSLGRCLCKTRQ
jgi:hypothetical protein